MKPIPILQCRLHTEHLPAKQQPDEIKQQQLAAWSSPSSLCIFQPHFQHHEGADNRVLVEVGTVKDNGILLYLGGIIWVQIVIEPPARQIPQC